METTSVPTTHTPYLFISDSLWYYFYLNTNKKIVFCDESYEHYGDTNVIF